MDNFFDEAFKKTLTYEGGLSDDVHDAGGLTKYGISQRAYPKEDIRNLTIEKAKTIYKRDYWDKCRCGEIKDKSLAMQIFDIAVNSGCGGAGRLLQNTINSIAKTTLKVDGAIGSVTVTIANSLPGKTLNNALVSARVQFYKTLCIKNPSQNVFLKGWTRRANSFIVR